MNMFKFGYYSAATFSVVMLTGILSSCVWVIMSMAAGRAL